MDIEVGERGMMLMRLEDTRVLVTKDATGVVELGRVAAAWVVDAVATVKGTEAGWSVLAGPLARSIHLGKVHCRAMFPTAQNFLREVGGRAECVVIVLLGHATARLCRYVRPVVLHHVVLS